MNDHRLQILAERAAAIVAPLAASRKRKSLVREELLAHLFQAYEEERSSMGDDQAVEAAIRRLGSTTEMTVRLQACVPAPEMVLALCWPRKETLMSRWSFLLLGLLGFFFGMGLILPALAKYKQMGALPTDGKVFLAGGLLIVLCGIALAAYGVKRLLVRRA
jgi:hypothetical protein